MQKSDWEAFLDKSGLTGPEKRRHRAIIRWYLSFCRGRQPSGEPGRNTANEFDRELRRTRNPSGCQLNQWGEGIRWFLGFLGEPAASQQPRPPSEKPGQGAWRLAMTGQCRLKHLSYRTEQTYTEWVSSFAGFLAGTDPMAATDADAVRFLSDLAVRKQVAGSTQNQAFNALLFFFRNVLGRPDVHWTGVQRAQKKRRQPAVLTPEELSQVFAQMEGTARLMARLLYGSGLRLMELIRLRVQHLSRGHGQNLTDARNAHQPLETRHLPGPLQHMALEPFNAQIQRRVNRRSSRANN